MSPNVHNELHHPLQVHWTYLPEQIKFRQVKEKRPEPVVLLVTGAAKEYSDPGFTLSAKTMRMKKTCAQDMAP